ncbi:DUF3306 domain-containing protein [Bradyrhizobium sp.]|uniref:DUF3306 domain-containing protein n=1 Tax=Bradyrhizobium sp. TaxID=376 RepID=UPI003C780E6F
MSDDKTFLARWSRRKREAAPDTGEQPKPENAGGGAASSASAASLSPGEAQPLFDPASLPPIDSIVAGSDISAFLAAGVPADLTRAALRRVWSSDHMIRDFVGLSENSWDFNAPGAMAGFGPIGKDEVARLVTGLLGEPDATAVAAHPPTSPSQTDNHASESGQARGIQAIPGSAGPVPAPDQQPQHLDTTSAANDVTQRREAVPASQHETSSGDQRQITTRLGHGSALPR